MFTDPALLTSSLFPSVDGFPAVAFGEDCILRSAILYVAGKPGNRWVCLRKKAGREESPDTVVFAS